MTTPAPSASAAVSATASTSSAVVTAASTANKSVPSPQSLVKACELALQQDRGIGVDYYPDTASQKAFVGVDSSSGEKRLVRSKREYTTPIQHLHRLPTGEYLAITENTVYILPPNAAMKKINMAAQLEDD